MRQSLLVVLVAGAAFIDCAKAPPPPPSMSELGVERNTAELRVLLHEYLRWFAGRVAETSNTILRHEEDVAVQEAALLLKVNLVPSMQAAVFQRDPVAALADVWALTSAAALFLESGNGGALFGPSQPVAVDALRGLETAVRRLVVDVVGTEATAAASPDIERWVRNNRIRDLTFVLPANATDIAAKTAAHWKTGGLLAVAQLDEMLRDLSDRMTIYAEQLPAVARWQGEILLLEAKRELLVESASDLGSMRVDVDTLTNFVTATPELIASERAHVLGALQTEREALLEDIERQRRETLTRLTSERQAITAMLQTLRQAGVADLGREADRHLERIEEMRSSTLAELDQASKAIDHSFWRAMQLLLVSFVGLILLVFVVHATRRRTLIGQPRRVARGLLPDSEAGRCPARIAPRLARRR